MGRKSKHKQTSKATPAKCNELNKQISDGIKTQASDAKPITITERLNLPPYDGNQDANDGSELQLDFRPRAYFVSSLCCLCSKACGDAGVPCEGCRMVAYCSAEHRQRHASSHRQLCVALSRVCRQSEGLSLAKGLDADEYRSLRVRLLSAVEKALARRMELWEREILLYPRLCWRCHGAEALANCSGCRMEYFCAAEAKGHRDNHADYCMEFRVFRTILEMQKEHGFVTPRIPNVAVAEGYSLPGNFDAVVQEVFASCGCEYEKIDCSSYAALSVAASPVLTALYALQTLSRPDENYMHRKSLKIHIIGAELQFECANLGAWEKLFLHLVPKLRNLRLEFCGPELQVPPNIAEILEHPRLCVKCRAKNCKLDIVFHCGKLYHQIENDKPDLICLFNPGLYRMTGFANQDTWPRTIQKFCDYGVPILVTSYTEVELPLDLKRMREFRNLKIEQEPRRNPFASLRPERNFVSDDVTPLIYKNYFLSVTRGVPGIE